MRMYRVILILLSTTVSVSFGECQFPPRWSAGHWMLQKIFPVNNTVALLNFRNPVSFESTSTSPDVETTRFACEDFRLTDNAAYWVKKVINDANPNRRYCMFTSQTENVILYKEIETIASEVSDCKSKLEAQKMYGVLLPVTPLTTHPVNSTFDYQTSVQYPPSIGRQNYRVTFTPPGEEEQCGTDPNSALVVNNEYISILGCKYTTYALLPLTGLIRVKSYIEPEALSEPDKKYGGIMILDWNSRSLPHNRTYCSRFKTFDDKTIRLSIDLTSGEPTELLSCRRNQNYTDQGKIDGRNYFTMIFKDDASLASRPPVSVTTRIPTTYIPGASVSTTVRTTYSKTYVRLTVDKRWLDIDNLTALAAIFTEGLANLLNVDQSVIENVTSEEDKDGDTDILFMLKTSTAITQALLSDLSIKIDSGTYAIAGPDGMYIGFRRDTLFSWKDDSPCPISACANNGSCWRGGSNQFFCKCQQSYTGNLCETEVNPNSFDAVKQIKMRNIGIGVGVAAAAIVIVIIIVIIIIRLKCRGKPDPYRTGSESGYNNQMSLEQRDREIYSTINKQPKAFHEKSFTNLDTDGDYGEKTGIHL